MRLFIALDFDDKDYFLDIQEQIPKDLAKMTHPKTFHLTLKFLGDVPDNKIEDIKEKLRKVSFEPTKITIDKIGTFPSESYVKVVWVGINEADKVIELQQGIEKALEGLFPKDNRFHPHITLARVMFVKDKALFTKKIKELKPVPKEFSISTFKLIKSTLTGKGPVYEVLESFPS